MATYHNREQWRREFQRWRDQDRFFAECLEHAENAFTPLPDIRRVMERWCRNNEVEPFTDTALGRLLSYNGGTKSRGPLTGNGKRDRIWLYIAIQPEERSLDRGSARDTLA